MAYIMIQHDGKNIGLYDTDSNVYIKHGVKKSKHFFKKLKAWGVDSVTFRNILKPEARIVIEEVEERKRYETDKETMGLNGEYMNFGKHGIQIFLPVTEWKVTDLR